MMAWCEHCKQETIPLRSGNCPWCMEKIGASRPAKVHVDEPLPEEVEEAWAKARDAGRTPHPQQSMAMRYALECERPEDVAPIVSHAEVEHDVAYGLAAGHSFTTKVSMLVFPDGTVYVPGIEERAFYTKDDALEAWDALQCAAWITEHQGHIDAVEAADREPA